VRSELFEDGSGRKTVHIVGGGHAGEVTKCREPIDEADECIGARGADSAHILFVVLKQLHDLPGLL